VPFQWSLFASEDLTKSPAARIRRPNGRSWDHHDSRESLAQIHIDEGIMMEAHLSSHHRDTVEKIFSHPASRNIEWRQVASLLETIGTVTQEHNGKLKVTLGPETEVLPAPHGEDVDVQMVVDLRRMLKQAGYGPESSQAISDERSRDHGDG
jgi:hypothetical protein